MNPISLDLVVSSVQSVDHHDPKAPTRVHLVAPAGQPPQNVTIHVPADQAQGLTAHAAVLLQVVPVATPAPADQAPAADQPAAPAPDAPQP